MKDLERRAIAEAVQGVLRHEARNKVGAIRNAAFFLRRKTEKTPLWAEPRVADFFELIEDQLKQLELVLGERAGDSGVTHSSAPTVMSVAACVRAALPEASPGQVELRLDEQLHAAIDPAALTLALRCVLDNALEALEGGKVFVTAAMVDGAPGLRVEDGGPGFTEARLGKPMTPLESTRSGRAGVGLLVAWRLLRSAGGDLTIKNAEGEGAIVELRLPPTVENPT